MNERITQMAEQAYFDCDITTSIKIPREFVEKFAELIVRECCAIADLVERADMDSYVSKFIKAHFGVE